MFMFLCFLQSKFLKNTLICITGFRTKKKHCFYKYLHDPLNNWSTLHFHFTRCMPFRLYQSLRESSHLIGWCLKLWFLLHKSPLCNEAVFLPSRLTLRNRFNKYKLCLVLHRKYTIHYLKKQNLGIVMENWSPFGYLDRVKTLRS